MKDNIEPCKKCGYPVDIGELVPSITGSSIPFNSTATLLKIPLRKTLSLAYVALKNEAGDLITPLWRIWVKDEDVYVKSMGSESWKLSIHKSGHDNVSFMGDYVGHFLGQTNDRRILHATRSRPFDAHFNRILCLEFKGHSNGRVIIPSKKIKPKYKTKLRYNVGGTDPFQLQFLYSKGHPDRFRETLLPDSILLGIFKASRDDYITVVSSSETEFRITSEPRLKLGICRSVDENTSITTDFGMIMGATFYIKQTVRTSCNVHSRYLSEDKLGKNSTEA